MSALQHSSSSPRPHTSNKGSIQTATQYAVHCHGIKSCEFLIYYSYYYILVPLFQFHALTIRLINHHPHYEKLLDILYLVYLKSYHYFGIISLLE